MKTKLLLGALLAGLTCLASAELKIPRGVFEVEQLDEAKVKAAEDEEPLIFVYMDPGST